MCSVKDCEGRVVARGYCRKHYTRWNRYGDPLVNRRPELSTSLEERFWSRVDKSGECWLWTSSTVDGYGRFTSTPVGTIAHRIAYWLTHGELPDETIDHQCHNQDPSCPGGRECPHRRCVRPDHLVPRSRAKNHRLGRESRAICANGHEKSGSGRCVECAREAGARFRDRHRKAGPRLWRNGNSGKTECKRGHPFDEVNTGVDLRTGKRYCKACKRARGRRRQQPPE